MKSKGFFSFLKKHVEQIIVFLLLAGFLLFYLYIISKTFYIDPEGNIRTAFSGFGDIPLHLSQITKFAFDKLNNLNEPIFAGSKLQYPFLINLFSGLLLRLTNSWTFSVLLPPMLLSVGSLILMYLIYKRFLKKSLITFLAIIVFFFGSGMGAYRYIETAVVENQSARQVFDDLLVNNRSTIIELDKIYPDQNIVYGAPITLTIHQRPFFIGFFAFVLLMFLMIRILDGSKSKFTLILAGIVYALMPIAHMHTFIAATILLTLIFIIQVARRHEPTVGKIFFVVLIGVILALPQVIYLTSGKDVLHSSASFISYRLGWMTEPSIGSINFGSSLHSVFTKDFIKFCWVNFGIILPLFILCSLGAFLPQRFLKKYLSSDEIYYFKLFSFSGLILFLLVQMFRFQPWDFDDNKILIYYQFFAVPIIFFVLKKLFDTWNVVGTLIIILFFVVASYSGVVDQVFRVGVEPNTMPVIFEQSARNLSTYILKNIPENDLILTGTTHLNPVASLAGRPVLVGFPGWLWTRGIDYSQREQDLRIFYLDPLKSNWVIKKYDFKYILIDNQAVSEFKADRDIFDKYFLIIFSQGQYTLYKIK
ncbi:MAG: 2 protein [Candidatus Berkelbacteria bacterium]|nr:2 protein [Candidatus Berkelbacteria bacterium]